MGVCAREEVGGCGCIVLCLVFVSMHIHFHLNCSHHWYVKNFHSISVIGMYEKGP